MFVGVRNRKLDSKGTDNRTVEWTTGLKVKYGPLQVRLDPAVQLGYQNPKDDGQKPLPPFKLSGRKIEKRKGDRRGSEAHPSWSLKHFKARLNHLLRDDPALIPGGWK